MISIPAGHIFCELYNKETGQNLTPKQIFCEVIAPIVFKPTIKVTKDNEKETKRLLLDYWQNFCMSPTSTIKGYGCTPYAIEKFVKEVEDDSQTNLMTTFKVWAGCGNPLSGDATTICCANDNLFFSVDERYESFIGAFFRIGIGRGYTIFVNDPKVIKILFDSWKIYSKILSDNENIDGKQLSTWNGIALYEIAYRGKLDAGRIVDSYIEKTKTPKKNITHILKTQQIPKILFALSKLSPETTVVETINAGQTNISAGPILLLNHKDMETIYDFYDKIFHNVNEDFNHSNYIELLGWDSIIEKVLNQGMVVNNMFNPNLDKLEDKYLIEYCRMTMNTKTYELCQKFAEALLTSTSRITLKNSCKPLLDKLFSSSKPSHYNETMAELTGRQGFIDNPIFDEIDKIINCDDVNVREIMSLIKIKYNRLKVKNNEK